MAVINRLCTKSLAVNGVDHPLKLFGNRNECRSGGGGGTLQVKASVLSCGLPVYKTVRAPSRLAPTDIGRTVGRLYLEEVKTFCVI